VTNATINLRQTCDSSYDHNFTILQQNFTTKAYTNNNQYVVELESK